MYVRSLRVNIHSFSACVSPAQTVLHILHYYRYSHCQGNVVYTTRASISMEAISTQNLILSLCCQLESFIQCRAMHD